MELLPSFKTCFFCGTQNRSGFGIRYYFDRVEGHVVGWTEPGEALCGYPGVLHGGIQSALLDDVMYWAASYLSATSSVTLELRCRFRKTAQLGQKFTLSATAESDGPRKVLAEGRLLGESGEVLAEANGTYLLHPREVFVSQMLPWFDFEGCPPAVVSRFCPG